MSLTPTQAIAITGELLPFATGHQARAKKSWCSRFVSVVRFYADALALQTDGNILVGGQFFGCFGANIQCQNANGSVDGSFNTTQEFLWRPANHSLIESVLIPANPALYGEPSDRQTLCDSTQVGYTYGSKFCASGLDGWKRGID